ncbi:MAG: DUF4058 family protein [Planctomycetes bacterium]|nr:DUF4058 family protein [Planctomycetota bacterium]
MPSPFPGMDPYLEQHWGDIHHRLVTYASDQLQARLPRDLRARVEERVFLEQEGGESSERYPDVRVVELGSLRTAAEPPTTGVQVAEPLVIQLQREPITQGYIQIIDLSTGGGVVTVIELLSPTNKLPGEGRKLYEKKREELWEARVSLVEIDLTRKGKRVLSVAAERIPRSHRTTYQVCVRRGWSLLTWEVYRVALEEPLPAIRVPLRQKDPDVPLELQPLIEQCYRNGAYEGLDYRREPDPPLDPEDAAWAAELLRAKGLRG